MADLSQKPPSPAEPLPPAALAERLQSLWQEVLGLDEVPPERSFLELGGDSLAAARIVAQAGTEFGLEFPLTALVEAETFADFAGAVTAATPAAVTALPPAGAIEAPLSLQQRRLWLAETLAPASAAYHVSMRFAFEGELDPARLAKALRSLADRHPMLRAALRETEEEPRLGIAAAIDPILERIDLGGLDPAGQAAELARRSRALVEAPFDLAEAPLWRGALFQLGQSRAELLLVLHHMISDGWSRRVLLADLAALYRDGTAAPLPALQTDYPAYATAERAAADDRPLPPDLVERFRDLPLLDLPTDRPRVAGGSLSGAAVERRLDAARLAVANRHARDAGVTLFTLLAAAFGALLHRMSGATDLVIAAPVASRDRPELEPLIGFFIGLLPIRLDLDGDPTFATLLERARDASRHALRHRHIPFDRLVEAVNPPRSGDRHAIAQVALNMLNLPMEAVDLPGLQIRPLMPPPTGSAFDFTLHVHQHGGELLLELVYRDALFDRWRMADLLAQFEVLLAAAMEHPGLRLSKLPLLSEKAVRATLAIGCGPDPAFAAEPLPTLLARAAARHADRTAILAAGEAISYAALESAAATLAHRLRQAGARRDEPVAILLPRSPALVIAMLACWKAGAAFLCLPPDNPKARTARMAALAGARIAVTDIARASLLPPDIGQCVLIAEAAETGPVAAEETAPAPVSPPAPDIALDDLAYVTFTSGSTGEPKGIETPHAGPALVLPALIERHALGPQDRVLQLAATAWDASYREIFATLLAGATLVLLSDEEARSPAAILERMDSERITALLSVVPTLLAALLEEAGERRPRLRLLLSTGEALSKSLALAAADRFGAAIVNNYGPSEATLTQLFHPVSAADDELLPVGRPIPGYEVLLLDTQLAPVPPGNPGEICIAGPGLARGYCGRPDLTAERFRRHRFADGIERRFYRTGDLGRWRRDGSLLFLGRADRQIKLRGVRIEPGEIEAAIRRLPEVAMAAVHCWNPGAPDARLVAYIVPGAGAAPDRRDLRARLGEHLPATMLPADFVPMDRLPLLANGKLDAGRLPRPEAPQSRGRPPETPSEMLVAQLFRELLRLPTIDAEADFFAFGGHSLLAARLFARIERKTGRRLPLTLLLEQANVAHIAAALDRADSAADWESLVPVRRHGTETPLFCVHGLSGDVLFARRIAPLLSAERPLWALRARELRGAAAARPSVEAVAADYIAEIRKIRPNGPYHLAGVCFGGLVVFEMARQLTAAGAALGLVCILDNLAPDTQLLLPRIRRQWRSWTRRSRAAAMKLFKRGGRHLLSRWMRRVGTPEHVIRRVERPSFSVPAMLDLIARRYRPGVHRGPIAVLAVPETQSFAGGDASLGWRRFARGPLTCRPILGTHHSMLVAPNLASNMQVLNALLTEAEAAQPLAEAAE